MANLDGFDHKGQDDMDEFVFDWTSKSNQVFNSF